MGRLTSKKAVRHFHNQLVKRELSVPDRSVQGALAETAILIMQNKARMLLVDARLGIECTMLAVKYATLLIYCGRCVANPDGRCFMAILLTHATSRPSAQSAGYTEMGM